MKLGMGLILVCSLLFVGGPLFAGDGAGNGNTIACDRDGVEMLALLDFFEWRDSVGPVDLGDASLTVEEKVDRALARIESRDPARFARYRKAANEFFALTQWVSEDLYDFRDTGKIAVAIPANCRLRQVSIQRPQLFASDRKYIVDERLWNRLGRDDQAGVVIHEIVYGETLSLKQPTSRLARQFTATVASANFARIPAAEYERLRAQVFGGGSETPIFREENARLAARTGQPFTFDANSLVVNPGGGPVSWSLISGPSWLTVSSAGTLSGTPAQADVGEAQFSLAVADGSAGAVGKVTIEVTE